MPESSVYKSHLSLEAAAFILAMPRRKQRVLLDLADQLAKQPFEIGDYQTSDAVGRTIENLLLKGYLFSFWVDHASREVRITEIIRV